MSVRAGIVSLFTLVFCAAFLVEARAQGPTANFIISGTSTVRSWSCPAQGAVKVTPGKSSPAVLGFPNGIQSVSVTVQVKAIDCTENAEDMNAHLLDTLKEKTFPQIVYQLDQYTVSAGGRGGPGAGAQGGGGATGAKATGKLTITGVTRPITFDVMLTKAAGGVRVAGETTMDITQFKIVPPTLWAGMLVVGKEIRVRFDAVLPVQ